MYDIGSLKLLPTIKLNHNINMVQTFPYTGLFENESRLCISVHLKRAFEIAAV